MWKVKGSGQNVDKDHGRQQEQLGRSCQVDNVFSCPGVALIVLVMCNQWIGADRHYLIKKVQGKKVVGQRNTDGSEDRQGKSGVEPGLGMFLQSPHIAHRVIDRNSPER